MKARDAVFGRLSTDAALVAAMGGVDPETGLVRFAPHFFDIARVKDNDFPRGVYRVPVEETQGAITRASASIHFYAETVSEMRAIDQEVRRLFGGASASNGAGGAGWQDGALWWWAVMVGGGEDPRTSDDEPLHWWREVDMDGSAA